jgi:hypothetical protein
MSEAKFNKAKAKAKAIVSEMKEVTATIVKLLKRHRVLLKDFRKAQDQLYRAQVD